ncbi:MAG TPA: hypothetical protein VKA53_09410 [Thermoanaerobaculia bacterium]|nr:hypothetical protein [Thermoanaerobaculia bacterium]
MKSVLAVTFEGSHVRVQSDGEKSYPFALKLWTEVGRVCRENHCFRVLGIAKTTLPVSTLEGFDHIEIFAAAGITPEFRIAWVELNPDAFVTTRFIETVLLNRGVANVRLFSQVEPAKEWLLGSQRAEEAISSR